MIYPNYIVKSIINSSNTKFPIYPNHYVCGYDITRFANLICIESNLTNFSNKIYSLFNECKNTHKNH